MGEVIQFPGRTLEIEKQPEPIFVPEPTQVLQKAYSGPTYKTEYGNKYDRDLDVKEVAKRVRTAIKDAIKKGTIPAVKTSVRIDRFSGGQSLDVTITEVGIQVINPELVAERLAEPHKYHYFNQYYTEAGQNLLAVIKGFVNAYNFDGSDSQSDYFHVNFYGDVKYDWRITEVQTAQIEADLKNSAVGA